MLEGKINQKTKGAKVKSMSKAIVLLMIVSGYLFAGANKYDNVTVNTDSVNIMVEASLFFEAYKNKQYDYFTLEHGFKLLNTKPDAFPQFKPYKKLDKVIWAMYTDTTGRFTDEQKVQLADTLLYLYDMALKYDTANAGTYLVKRAYVLEEWKEAPLEDVIAAYEAAFASGKKFANETYYKDRLGKLYAANASEENDYKMKALDLYSSLSEMEPDNATWVSRIEALAENQDELVDITKKAWDIDKENIEKAWKYASMCIKTKKYDRALEPLNFLIEKSPDVINYWRELARAYQKLERYDDAIRSYKKLIELEPDNKVNYLNIAIIYQKLEQLPVARTYLLKAIKKDPNWDYPYWIEGQIYEKSARDCGTMEFIDKCVYQLAINKYKKAASLGGVYSEQAAGRAKVLKQFAPSQEDYFFRNLKSGDKIKIEGKCYDWINREIVIP
ncbi:MAG: tetratricopeptide repeat protein [Ignavibacteria bacterium]|nr:MAG: tetratricopeptide repeat protein [Ignavibacteria bacterium]